MTIQSAQPQKIPLKLSPSILVIVYGLFNEVLAQIKQRRIMGRLEIWEIRGRKRSWPNLRYYCSIWLDGLKSQENRGHVRDWNRALHGNTSEALPLWPGRSDSRLSKPYSTSDRSGDDPSRG